MPERPNRSKEQRRVGAKLLHQRLVEPVNRVHAVARRLSQRVGGGFILDRAGREYRFRRDVPHRNLMPRRGQYRNRNHAVEQEQPRHHQNADGPEL